MLNDILSNSITEKTLGLFFQINRPNIVGAVSFDAFISESHNITADITQIPLESGALVTDHIIFKPLILNITAVVSNTPLRYFGGLDNLQKGVQLIKDAFTLSGDYRQTFAQKAWISLLTMFSDAQELTITTANSVYPNMVIVAIDTTSDKDTSEILEVNLTFQQIQRRTLGHYEDGLLSEGIHNRAAGQVDLGAVSVVPFDQFDMFNVIEGLFS